MVNFVYIVLNIVESWYISLYDRFGKDNFKIIYFKLILLVLLFKYRFRFINFYLFRKESIIMY